MTRTQKLNILWERAFDLGCTLDGAIGFKYLTIANRLALWLLTTDD